MVLSLMLLRLEEEGASNSTEAPVETKTENGNETLLLAPNTESDENAQINEAPEDQELMNQGEPSNEREAAIHNEPAQGEHPAENVSVPTEEESVVVNVTGIETESIEPVPDVQARDEGANEGDVVEAEAASVQAAPERVLTTTVEASRRKKKDKKSGVAGKKKKATAMGPTPAVEIRDFSVTEPAPVEVDSLAPEIPSDPTSEEIMGCQWRIPRKLQLRQICPLLMKLQQQRKWKQLLILKTPPQL